MLDKKVLPCHNNTRKVASMTKYIGDKYNRLTVVEFSHRDKNHHHHYKCRCDCGNESIVGISSLRSGHTKSCGCLNIDNITKHGMCKTRIYNIYHVMIKRCYNKNIKHYQNYGARGIGVCPEWRESFVVFKDWAFANGYTDRLTLDRIDNDGNYCPENCRWATMKEQSANKRAPRSNTSGTLGVGWDKTSNKWRASANNTTIGRFKTKEEAAIARNEYIKENNLPHKLSEIR